MTVFGAVERRAQARELLVLDWLTTAASAMPPLPVPPIVVCATFLAEHVPSAPYTPPPCGGDGDVKEGEAKAGVLVELT